MLTRKILPVILQDTLLLCQKAKISKFNTYSVTKLKWEVKVKWLIPLQEWNNFWMIGLCSKSTVVLCIVSSPVCTYNHFLIVQFVRLNSDRWNTFPSLELIAQFWKTSYIKYIVTLRIARIPMARTHETDLWSLQQKYSENHTFLDEHKKTTEVTGLHPATHVF
jgi:hypothetical protein